MILLMCPSVRTHSAYENCPQCVGLPRTCVPFLNPDGYDSLLHIRRKNIDMLGGVVAPSAGSSIHMYSPYFDRLTLISIAQTGKLEPSRAIISNSLAAISPKLIANNFEKLWHVDAI